MPTRRTLFFGISAFSKNRRWYHTAIYYWTTYEVFLEMTTIDVNLSMESYRLVLEKYLVFVRNPRNLP